MTGSVTGYRPLRSILYMPASNARALEKAKTIPCDGLIVDLEDAVAPDAKAAAREAACAAATSGDYGRRTIAIRINGLDTPWHDDDLAAACAAAPDAILAPKIGSADEIRALAAVMDDAGVPAETRLWAMIESPAAILESPAIARSSPRLGAFIIGTNDLTRDLRATALPSRAPILPALQFALLAGRAAGIAVLDGVFNDVRDHVGFGAECRQGRDLGFDGKTLIHPGQVAGANHAFAPSEADVEDAHDVINAWEAGEGAGVVTYRGRMIELLHVNSARRVLEIAAAIEALAEDA